MVEFFGIEIKRTTDKNAPKSVIRKEFDDGALNVQAAGGLVSTVMDLEGSAKNEAELVSKYRDLALQPEIDFAIDDIVNEAMATDENIIATLNLDNVELPKKIKNKILEEFKYIKRKMEFDQNSYDIFKKFYVDGRLRYHIIPEKNLRNGIAEIRYVDPRKIRKVRELDTKGEHNIQFIKDEYYIYSENAFYSLDSSKDTGFSSDYNNIETIKIRKDSIAEVTSGIMDKNNQVVLSYLNKALKPFNQLRILEDSIVIYRISRAPERRIFYIDVSGLPRQKAEAYIKDMIRKHRNKAIYDASTGQIKSSQNMMTMLDDYWFPRRADGKATEVTTLNSGMQLGELTDIQYFLEKLYKSLNIPYSRVNPENSFNFGRASEITRDELKFTKFIGRIRKRFSQIFIKILEKQLILKGIMNSTDFSLIKESIFVDFAADNFFSELKHSEILRSRLETYQMIGETEGQYFSKNWIQRNIFSLSDEEIDKMDEEIKEENKEEEENPQDSDEEDASESSDSSQEEPKTQETTKE